MINERTEVEAANKAFYREERKKDIEAMSCIWLQENGSFCIHPGSDILRGWKDIEIS